ncbi:hypothetical protein B296_00026378 [Ensete ventricosum]|uniref:Uncharacterized protein n=1 Tax=Ensete ventricosum TaxID=4639 RepID=A0A426XTG1_ENSVE|nr:hypothetical protein B296_00026378 [Ensete ventricosum]
MLTVSRSTLRPTTPSLANSTEPSGLHPSAVFYRMLICREARSCCNLDQSLFRYPAIAYAPSFLMRMPRVRPPLPAMPTPSFSVRLTWSPKSTAQEKGPIVAGIGSTMSKSKDPSWRVLAQPRKKEVRPIVVGLGSTALARGETHPGESWLNHVNVRRDPPW